MIVPMKKVTLLLSTVSHKKAVNKLRRLGVVHINPVQAPESEDLESLQRRIERLDKALTLLEGSEPGSAAADGPDPEKAAEEIIVLHERRKKLESKLDEMHQTARWFSAFGPVSRGSLAELRENGVEIDFYTADKSAVKKLPADAELKIASEQHGTVYFAHFRSEDEEKLNLKPAAMPPVEYRDLVSDMQETEKSIDAAATEFRKMAAVKQSLETRRFDLEKETEFHTVIGGMGDAGDLVYLQGFCPRESTDLLRQAADKDGWAYLIEDPEHPEDVPTLIRKPRWLRMIDPLFDFMGTVPGYSEYDISFWFLLFFSLFFAMLIGDAGYGLIFLGLAVWASFKFPQAPRAPFYLIYTLSGATIIWGVITGNWFGYAPIGKLPFFNSLVIDEIDSFAGDNSIFLMYVCFVIGVVHLSVAHALKALKILNSPRALAELGWIGILWALFFVAGNLVIEKPLPSFMMPLLAGSIALTLVFSNYQKNILRGIGASLGDLPLSIISSFSDVVSYLRLFAVGYASVTVAASFNNMAVGGGIHSILAGITAALVLLLGHSLNIVLGLMAVIVHGVRLNMLEFSGQLDMQWAGKPYKPFSE